jgi:hypothetical protein
MNVHRWKWAQIGWKESCDINCWTCQLNSTVISHHWLSQNKSWCSNEFAGVDDVLAQININAKVAIFDWGFMASWAHVWMVKFKDEIYKMERKFYRDNEFRWPLCKHACAIYLYWTSYFFYLYQLPKGKTEVRLLESFKGIAED